MSKPRPPMDDGALRGILLGACLGGQVWMLVTGLVIKEVWPFVALTSLAVAAVVLIIMTRHELP